ncbi:MAG: hypothetical protein GXP25_17710 [Planctomycetes bacterium]|nr:hypothetical protein [Planctomycetota bacterium]
MAKQNTKKKKQKQPWRRKDPTRSKPLSLDALKEYGALEGFEPPEGDFDPTGAWDHLYRFWLVGNPWQQYRGFFQVTRSAPAEGSLKLCVNRSILLSQHPAFHNTEIQMTCAADALCTPRSWELKAETRDIHGKPFDESRVEESASVHGGTITTKRNGRDLTRTIPTPFTSDFSLLDVVQRLPKGDTKPIEFALLQEMDEIKEDQSLSYREKLDFEIGGRTLPLHCYQQIGRGLLPYRYYVDDHGRLLFAFSAVRAYIYDPKARQQQRKSVDWLITKEKRRRKK